MAAPTPPVTLDYDSTRAAPPTGADGLVRRAALWAGVLGGAGAAMDRLVTLIPFAQVLKQHGRLADLMGLAGWWVAAQLLTLFAAVALTVACALALRRLARDVVATLATVLFLTACLLRAAAEAAVFLGGHSLPIAFILQVGGISFTMSTLNEWLPILAPPALLLATAATRRHGRTALLAIALALAACQLVGTIVTIGRTVIAIPTAEWVGPWIADHLLWCGSVTLSMIGFIIATYAAWRTLRTRRRATAIETAIALCVAELTRPATIAFWVIQGSADLVAILSNGSLWAYVGASLLLAAAVPTAVLLAFGDKGDARQPVVPAV